MATDVTVTGLTNGTGRGLQRGYWVALVLREGSAPFRCATGQIREVDEHGVRMTLTHWAVEQTLGWDFYAPWGSITAALVATPDHDIPAFGEAAARFRDRCADLP